MLLFCPPCWVVPSHWFSSVSTLLHKPLKTQSSKSKEVILLPILGLAQLQLEGQICHSAACSVQAPYVSLYVFMCVFCLCSCSRCKVCPLTFFSKSDMQIHSKTHTEAKAHKCPHCTKSFANASYLAQHLRIHLGVKPYRCSYCEKSFRQLSHLQQHTRSDLCTHHSPFMTLIFLILLSSTKAKASISMFFCAASKL